jgi:hypothetical protein
MKETLKVLNELETLGLYGKYAIGGAMAATFYAEPVLTYDLDIFILLPQSGGLAPLSPLYRKLREMGFKEKEECLEIHGTPVQFLPAFNALLEEALLEARETTYEDVPTRVVGPEHLVAICLQTGRAKDRERVRLIREEAKLDIDRLVSIVRRHKLEDRWKAWTT